MSANYEAQESAAGRAKPYKAPHVIEYGALRDVTLAAGNTGKNDGGGGPVNNKTAI